MSEEQAHHIYHGMGINVIIDGESVRSIVSEEEIISKAMERICSKMGLQLTSNHFFMCGGVVLNANFSFGFYKTELFTQDGNIMVMSKMPFHKMAEQAKICYDQWELHKLIQLLQEARDEVIQNDMKRAVAYHRYVKKCEDNRALRKLKEKLKKIE